MDIFDVFTVHKKNLYTVLDVRVEEGSLFVEGIIELLLKYGSYIRKVLSI
jgi:hypothetical protein